MTNYQLDIDLASNNNSLKYLIEAHERAVSVKVAKKAKIPPIFDNVYV